MSSTFDPETPVESYHPGHPRFVRVGEPIHDSVFVIDADDTGLDVDVEIDQGSRDNLAPRLPDLSVDPENYDADDFEWSVVSTPDESDGDVLSFATSKTEILRYDAEADNAAEFVADVPGEYVLGLDAPDGQHELTLYAFPEGTGAPRPRIELDGEYDETGERFRIESNANLAPSSDADPADLRVEFLADDRDALATADVEIADDGRSATVPVAALDGETARVHAAAYDGHETSVQDSVELDPAGDVFLPNRSPEWIDDAVMYQIFPRSWAGERGKTTFQTLIGGDEETGARGVEYLDELGVDVLWVTPVVPATSAQMDLPPGGPHGYGTLDYLGIAEDLVPESYDDPVAAYADFVEACNERGIKVLFDLVINHAGRWIDQFVDTIAEGDQSVEAGNSATVEAWNEESKYFDWWDRVDSPRYAEDGSQIEAAPRATGFADLQWMPNINYENLAMREYILSVADFWSREVGVDGFRCDVAYGVPHSFWKDVRELVRDNNSEFLLLDETLPTDPAFSENEFDMHYDSYGFTFTAQNVLEEGDGLTDGQERVEHLYDFAADPSNPEQLVEDVLARRDHGVPEHSRVLNAVENHDEQRLLNRTAVDLANPDRDSVTEAEWDDAAKGQRAAFAACVALPGVPMIYYGQERQISRYGEGRVSDPDDRRGRDDDGNVRPEADVRPGGRQRAFMNWEEYDEDHLEFYKGMIDLYHDLDVLHPDAKLSSKPTDDEIDAVLFTRDASERDDVSGPETVLVVVNFESEPVTIGLPEGVESENLAVDDGGSDGRTVTVDTVGVFAVTGTLAEN
jgi:glycosidase